MRKSESSTGTGGGRDGAPQPKTPEAGRSGTPKSNPTPGRDAAPQPKTPDAGRGGAPQPKKPDAGRGG
jgi:hypothetical protein